MKVDFSKDFKKSVQKLSGKILKSVIASIDNVKVANSIQEINNCKKIESLNNVYRIRIGDKRAFFIFHIEIDGDLAFLNTLSPEEKLTIRKIWRNLGIKIFPNSNNVIKHKSGIQPFGAIPGYYFISN